jgi:hypothetical protein
MGGFAPGFATLDNQDLGTPFPERNRQRQSDDAAADNNDVPRSHICIVKDGG